MNLNLGDGTRGMIIGALRKVFAQSYIAKTVRKLAISEQQGKRGGAMYTCAVCKQSFPPQKTQIDHIDPVLPVGYEQENKPWSWDWYISRLFCKIDNLQVICFDCHDAKSRAENDNRNEIKRTVRRQELQVSTLECYRKDLYKKCEEMPILFVTIDMIKANVFTKEEIEFCKQIVFKDNDGQVKHLKQEQV